MRGSTVTCPPMRPQHSDEVQRSARRLLLGGLFALATAGAAHAQTGAGLLLEPFPKEQAFDGRAEGLVFDGGHVQKTDEDFDFRIYNTQGRVRLFPGELASPRLGYDFTYLDTESSALPRQLIDQSIGVAFPIGKFDEWIVGLSLGIGYAGDTPFGDGDAWYGQGTLAVFRQLSEHSAIVFVLDYNRNRDFLPDIPLPGVAYTTVLEPNIELTAGLPLSSVKWKPLEGLEVQASFTLLDNFSATIGYEVVKNLSIFANYTRYSHNFFIDGLPQNTDRLLFEQRRAEAGVRWEPHDGVRLEAALGYAWGGQFSVGFDQRDSLKVAEISDEPYIRGGIEIRF